MTSFTTHAANLQGKAILDKACILLVLQVASHPLTISKSQKKQGFERREEGWKRGGEKGLQNWSLVAYAIFEIKQPSLRAWTLVKLGNHFLTSSQ